MTINTHPSEQAERLYQALRKKGIIAVKEQWDVFKHIDINIPTAKLYIEVDGINHFTNPDQILRDFDRSHYSDVDGHRTFYVTNQIIDTHLNEVVEALVIVINERSSK